MKSRLITFLLFLLAAGAPALRAYPTSYYTTSSRLSSGHWVKIATDAEGIYQLTYDQLKAMGFDDPSKVQVYGYGATQFADNLFTTRAPDDIKPTATLHTADGRILFFGQGDVSVWVNSVTGSEASRFNVRRNYYDTRSYYFLSDSEGAAALPCKSETQASADLAPLDFHFHLDYFEDEVQTPINGGVGYHGAEVKAGDNIPYSVRIRNFRPTDAYSNGIFNYFVAISAKSSVKLSVTMEGEADKESEYHTSAWSIADGEYTAYNDARGSLTFTGSESKPLADTELRFTVDIPSVTLRYAAPDRAAVRYPRANIIDDTDPMLIINYPRAESQEGRQVVFSEVNSADELMVWCIDNLTEIAAYPTSYDAGSRTLSYVLPESYTRRSVVFRPSATYPAPTVVGDVPAQNLHGSATPDMLIITVPEYLEPARRLAEAHTVYQGLSVKVVLQDEIFNEFSSGARDAMAYRRYAKMYYDRRPEKFRYMLIFGPCNYDNRSIEVAHLDRVLTYQNTLERQSASTITNYASDNYFAMLADDYNHDNIHLRAYSIAVGRVPATTPAQANDYVDKAIRHLRSAPDYRAYGRALLCAGEGDRNTHLNHSVEVADTMRTYRPDFTFINVPDQLYRERGIDVANSAYRDIVRQELQRGVGYFTYSGHGDPNFIGDQHQWDRTLAASVKYDVMPMVMFSSCDQYCYDRNLNCLIEAMLFAPEGGCLAGVGASRSVYISYNQLSCVSLARAYSEARPGDTYGDIYVRSRQHVLQMRADGKIPTPDEALVNTLIYNLAGDPALPVYAPECSAVVAEIDGRDPADGAIEVKPLKPFHVKGSVTGADGSTDTGFNGKVTVRILAAPVTAETYNTRNEDNYEPATVTQQFVTLVDVETDVRDGRFDAVINSPVPSPVGDNRLIVYAIDDATGRTALASLSGITVGDFVPDDYTEADFAAPGIIQFYAGDPDFVSGSEMQAVVPVTAVIDPSVCGLDFSENGIATRTSISVDGLRTVDRLDRFVRRNDDGTVTLATTVDGLSEGVHSLTLTVVSNAGRLDRSTIDFVVVSRLDRPSVETEDDLARESATFDLAPATGSANTLLITDSRGNTVRRVSGVKFPYTWDLNDTAGNPVADGRYTVTALIRDGQDYTHSYPATVVVLR